MPKPRKALVSLEATPYYHCVSRCVRRAFLCGEDAETGTTFEHRREWIQNRLFELANVFTIDIAAYAVMSNHYHVVLHVDRDAAKAWTSAEVMDRWHRLFAGTVLTRRALAGERLSRGERLAVDKLADTWRKRLADISWFMRCLNEDIARRANKEDGCTGRFWEGRFKSQALLDEKALAACMAYVDLNPVRAGLAATPEGSAYTSVQERSQAAHSVHVPNRIDQQPKRLLPFAGNPRQPMPKGLPFRLTDYLELLDWTGRLLRDDKRGAIAHNQPPILERLQIDPRHWLYMADHFESPFKGIVGAVHKLRAVCEELGYRRTPTASACDRLLS